MTEILHTEPDGTVYRQVDVPDDQGYGQGWEKVDPPHPERRNEP